MAAVSDASWSKRARSAVVVIASLVLVVQVATVGARLAGSHARLLSRITCSLVLFTVGALREARSVDVGFAVMVGVLALGVLVGLAVAKPIADSR